MSDAADWHSFHNGLKDYRSEYKLIDETRFRLYRHSTVLGGLSDVKLALDVTWQSLGTLSSVMYGDRTVIAQGNICAIDENTEIRWQSVKMPLKMNPRLFVCTTLKDMDKGLLVNVNVDLPEDVVAAAWFTRKNARWVAFSLQLAF